MTTDKSYFAYIRVSTAKQGHGVSLQEQRSAINRYASRHDLFISQWFEERVTAAKRGRPKFTEMLKLLKSNTANGVIIHKIDRGARNLRDWADIGELIDQGVEIHFANEGLDLSSRSGRLSADIQAVVAADYIRNLREETRKGIYGRLKQGLYPLQAPIGYLDCGGGKPKRIDPVKGPLVVALFEAYASSDYSLEELVDYARTIGLSNRRGGALSKNGIWKTLRNPFYIGLMHIQATSKTFRGVHDPLLSRNLFDRVQDVMNRRSNTKTLKHNHLFRKMFKCDHCGYSIIGELQKGHVYYRCHTKQCTLTSIREDALGGAIGEVFSTLSMPKDLTESVQQLIVDIGIDQKKKGEEIARGIKVRVDQLEARLSRLIDLLLDKKIDEVTLRKKHAKLVDQLNRLESKLRTINADSGAISRQVREFVEHARNPLLTYEKASPTEKRELIKLFTSNRRLRRKTVVVELQEPFNSIATIQKLHYSGEQRDIPRTSREIVDHLINFTIHNSSYDTSQSP